MSLNHTLKNDQDGKFHVCLFSHIKLMHFSVSENTKMSLTWCKSEHICPCPCKEIPEFKYYNSILRQIHSDDSQGLRATPEGLHMLEVTHHLSQSVMTRWGFQLGAHRALYEQLLPDSLKAQPCTLPLLPGGEHPGTSWKASQSPLVNADHPPKFRLPAPPSQLHLHLPAKRVWLWRLSG